MNEEMKSKVPAIPQDIKMANTLDASSQATFDRLSKAEWKITEATIGCFWEVIANQDKLLIHAYGLTRNLAWAEATKQLDLLNALLVEKETPVKDTAT